MKKPFSFIILAFLCNFSALFAQKNVGIGTEEPREKLDVQGAIRIGNTQTQNAGTIRWTGSEFQAYNGKNWVGLGTQFITSNQVPSEGKLLFWANSGEGFFTVSHSENLFWNTRTNGFEIKGDLKAQTLGNEAGNFKVNTAGEIQAHSLALGGNLSAQEIRANSLITKDLQATGTSQLGFASVTNLQAQFISASQLSAAGNLFNINEKGNLRANFISATEFSNGKFQVNTSGFITVLGIALLENMPLGVDNLNAKRLSSEQASVGSLAANQLNTKDLQATGNAFLGNTSTGFLSATQISAGNNAFNVNSSGFITAQGLQLNTGANAYRFPSVNGAANTFLSNDGLGNLFWTATGGNSNTVSAPFISSNNLSTDFATINNLTVNGNSNMQFVTSTGILVNGNISSQFISSTGLNVNGNTNLAGNTTAQFVTSTGLQVNGNINAQFISSTEISSANNAFNVNSSGFVTATGISVNQFNTNFTTTNQLLVNGNSNLQFVTSTGILVNGNISSQFISSTGLNVNGNTNLAGNTTAQFLTSTGLQVNGNINAQFISSTEISSANNAFNVNSSGFVTAAGISVNQFNTNFTTTNQLLVNGNSNLQFVTSTGILVNGNISSQFISSTGLNVNGNTNLAGNTTTQFLTSTGLQVNGNINAQFISSTEISSANNAFNVNSSGFVTATGISVNQFNTNFTTTNALQVNGNSNLQFVTSTGILVNGNISSQFISSTGLNVNGNTNLAGNTTTQFLTSTGLQVNGNVNAQFISGTGLNISGNTNLQFTSVQGLQINSGANAYRFPLTNGAANTFLSNDGLGNLFWTATVGANNMVSSPFISSNNFSTDFATVNNLTVNGNSNLQFVTSTGILVNGNISSQFISSTGLNVSGNTNLAGNTTAQFVTSTGLQVNGNINAQFISSTEISSANNAFNVNSSGFVTATGISVNQFNTNFTTTNALQVNGNSNLQFVTSTGILVNGNINSQFISSTGLNVNGNTNLAGNTTAQFVTSTGLQVNGNINAQFISSTEISSANNAFNVNSSGFVTATGISVNQFNTNFTTTNQLQVNGNSNLQFVTSTGILVNGNISSQFISSTGLNVNGNTNLANTSTQFLSATQLSAANNQFNVNTNGFVTATGISVNQFNTNFTTTNALQVNGNSNLQFVTSTGILVNGNVSSQFISSTGLNVNGNTNLAGNTTAQFVTSTGLQVNGNINAQFISSTEISSANNAFNVNSSGFVTATGILVNQFNTNFTTTNALQVNGNSNLQFVTSTGILVNGNVSSQFISSTGLNVSGNTNLAGNTTAQFVTSTGLQVNGNVNAQFISGTGLNISGNTQLGFVSAQELYAAKFTTVGTNGSILFITGNAYSQNNSQLFWDNSNFRLGVGTNAPTMKLEINSSVNNFLRLVNSAVGTNRTDLWFSGTNANRNWIIGQDINNNGGTDFFFWNNTVNTNVMVIRASGNVGLGTNSPTEKLTVVGNGNILGNAFVSSSAFISGNLTLNNATNSYVFPTNRGTAGQVLQTDGLGFTTWATPSSGWGLTGNSGTNPTTNFIGTTDAQPLLLRSNNAFITISNKGAIGWAASNYGNIFIGSDAGLNTNLNAITTQMFPSTFIGHQAGRGANGGWDNTALGNKAFSNSVGGIGNIAIGRETIYQNTTGTDNIGIGSLALYNNTTGQTNIAIGSMGLYNNTTGAGNVAIGYSALYNSTGTDNIAIGKYAGFSETGSNKLYISNSGTLTPLIKGDFSTPALEINGSLRINTGANTVAFPTDRGTAGQVLQTDGAGNATWANAGGGWGLTGNDITADPTNFIGTTSNHDLILRTNNTEQARITAKGALEVGQGTQKNVFIGKDAGLNTDLTDVNVQNFPNTFIGYEAGRNNTTGHSNYFSGYQAGYSNTTGVYNYFSGYQAGYSNTIGSGNYFSGTYAGYSNTGSYNYFSGTYAGYSNTGNYNYFSGFSAGQNTTGSNNYFSGFSAGASNTSGNFNYASGYAALYSNSTGSGNVAIGYQAGFWETGSNSVFLGYQAGYWETGSNKLYISNSDTSTPLIWGDFSLVRVGIGRQAAANNFEVEGEASKTVASAWLANSDRRIKTKIESVENGLETIMKIRPVRFQYSEEWKKRNPSIKDRYYYNVIAQEYKTVFPDDVKGSGEYLANDSTEILQVDTYSSQIVAIKAIQELAQKVEALEKENAQLKAEKQTNSEKTASLEAKLEKLQGQISQILEQLSKTHSEQGKK